MMADYMLLAFCQGKARRLGFRQRGRAPKVCSTSDRRCSTVVVCFCAITFHTCGNFIGDVLSIRYNARSELRRIATWGSCDVGQIQ